MHSKFKVNSSTLTPQVSVVEHTEVAGQVSG